MGYVLGEISQVLAVEVVPGVDAQAQAVGHLGAVGVGSHSVFGVLFKSPGVVFGVQFNAVCSRLACAFQMLFVAFHKQGGADAGGFKGTQYVLQKGLVFHSVPTGLGGEYVGRIRHQGNLVGAHAQNQFQKGRVRVPLYVKVFNHWAERFHVCVANVALVWARVHGDAVGPKSLNAFGCFHYVGYVAATRVAQGGNFVDVDRKLGVGWHGAKVRSNPPEIFRYLWNSMSTTSILPCASLPKEPTIAVIGLGYVGLPLAVAFCSHFRILGYDISSPRVAELSSGKDRTLEVTESELQLALQSGKLLFTDRLEDIATAQCYVVTVPTPIDDYKTPDLTPLLAASKAIGSVLKKGDVVIYESTTYPGCTEEDCVPVLEKASGLVFNRDFFCGYSPERINPGDKVNTLTTIKKVTSGSTPEVAEWVDQLYRTIVKAGTFKASSLRVAEASKAIENAQRDVNISFVNELALIFDRLGIDTQEVLEAAGSKWNFLPFKPGLVGGHCIGVDPYYLAHKAQAVGYYPQVILSGRRVNDSMGVFVASKVVKLLIQKGTNVKGAKALILGLTFKENCPDLRNTRVVDILNELEQFGLQVDVHDPWADAQEAKHELGVTLTPKIDLNAYQAVVLAVSHREFSNLTLEPEASKRSYVLYDTKAFLPAAWVDGRL
jgi:UDP-N-acetyl-D-galactosamine dehydrogenase